MPFNISEFIDIHTHILPGIDDGSRNLAESVEMAEIYSNAGIKKIIATPHFIPGTAWDTPKEKILELVDMLQAKLDDEGIDLQIFGGMEIAYHKNLLQRIESGALLPLGGSGHYLIEPPFHGDLDAFFQCLSTLNASGYKLILAHPERIDGISENINLLRKLVQKGVYIQINSGSLRGHFGKRVKQRTFYLWERDCVHFVASDAHDTQTRRPLSETEWSTLLRGEMEEKILMYCNKNTRNLLL